jgi:leader peptidase (prepilin peptidase)/N-methyltransferase
VTELLAAFAAGLILGSFLNVCIYRLPRNRSVVRPRSYCPRCRAAIAWYDNVPLVSYALLGGRCRRCHERIPLRYPLVELLAGLLCAAMVWLHGLTPEAAKWSALAMILLALAFTDASPRRLLPDELTLGGIALGLALSIWVPMEQGVLTLLVWGILPPRWASFVESAGGALLAVMILWPVGWLFERVRGKIGLGLGDVKLVSMVGAFLGIHETLRVLILSSVGGTVVGLLYIKATGKDWRRYPLPFGTFIAAAAILYLLLRQRA